MNAMHREFEFTRHTKMGKYSYPGCLKLSIIQPSNIHAPFMPYATTKVEQKILLNAEIHLRNRRQITFTFSVYRIVCWHTMES